VTSLDLLCKYLLIMELRFVAMLYSNERNENSVAGDIKYSPGPFPIPGLCHKRRLLTSVIVTYFGNFLKKTAKLRRMIGIVRV